MALKTSKICINLGDPKLCRRHYDFCKGKITTRESKYGAVLRACEQTWREAPKDMWEVTDKKQPTPET